MTSVGDMLRIGLVSIGDALGFTFKGSHFTSKILRGGIFSNCAVKRRGCKKYVEIFTNVSCFSSLTAWTEACLQDVLEEYYTRYSSWKRVIHLKSGQSMGDLRDRCKLTEKVLAPEAVVEVYKELQRAYTINQEMALYIRETSGSMRGGWNLLPPHRLNASFKPPPPKRRKCSDEEAFERVQRLIIENSILAP